MNIIFVPRSYVEILAKASTTQRNCPYVVSSRVCYYTMGPATMPHHGSCHDAALDPKPQILFLTTMFVILCCHARTYLLVASDSPVLVRGHVCHFLYLVLI